MEWIVPTIVLVGLLIAVPPLGLAVLAIFVLYQLLQERK